MAVRWLAEVLQMRGWLVLLLLAGCEPGTGTDDTDPGFWYDAGDWLEPSWRLEYGIGGRSLVTELDGRALFGDDEGRFWRYDGVLPETWGPYGDHDRPYFTPLVAGDQLFARDERGNLIALDLTQDPPVLLWEAVDHMPVLYGDLAVVERNTTDPAVRARDAATGSVAWTAEGVAGSPRYVNATGRVCVLASTGGLTVLDATTGAIAWSVPAIEGLGESVGALGCGVRDSGDVVRWWSDWTSPELTVQSFDAEGNGPTELVLDDFGARAAALMDDGTLVAGGDFRFAVISAGLSIDLRHDDRTLLAIDPAGTLLIDAQTALVLTDGMGEPVWAGRFGATEATRIVGYSVVGEKAWVTDTREGILGQHRWTAVAEMGR